MVLEQRYILSEMYRFSLTLGCQLPKATMVLAGPNQPAFRLPPSVEIKERSFSTKANDLSKVIPEFWIKKMKTAFRYHDLNGDGKVTEKDVAAWANQWRSYTRAHKGLGPGKILQALVKLPGGPGKYFYASTYFYLCSMYISYTVNLLCRSRHESFPIITHYFGHVMPQAG